MDGEEGREFCQDSGMAGPAGGALPLPRRPTLGASKMDRWDGRMRGKQQQAWDIWGLLGWEGEGSIGHWVLAAGNGWKLEMLPGIV